METRPLNIPPDGSTTCLTWRTSMPGATVWVLRRNCWLAGTVKDNPARKSDRSKVRVDLENGEIVRYPVGALIVKKR